MIKMWPCKKCKRLSTSPEYCNIHRPPKDPDETFEDGLISALTSPIADLDGGITISGMTFPSSDSDL